MMWIRNILIVFCLILTSCASRRCFVPGPDSIASICLIDQNGFKETISNDDRLIKYQGVDFCSSQPYQKIFRVYHRDLQGHVKACVNTYYPNGQPKQYLEVCDGRAFGSYREWYESGNIKLETCVLGGEPDITISSPMTWLYDGEAFSWNEDGVLIASIPYQKGFLEGEALYYHDNGELWKRVFYRGGLREGVSETFTDDGILLEEAFYLKGERDGKSKRYWSENQVAAEEVFDKGRLIWSVYFDLEGKKVSEILDGNGCRAIFGKKRVAEFREYRNGFLDGKIVRFGSDQKPLEEFHVKDGLKHGEEIHYFSHPGCRDQKLLSINWFEDKIQGIVKTWYDNGNLESQREMSQNQRNGLSSAWYRDGSLMLIEEYENDKLKNGEYFQKDLSESVSKVENGEGEATLYDAEGNFQVRVSYFDGDPLVD